MSAPSTSARRPSFSSLLALGLAVGLQWTLLQQTGGTTIAGLGIGSVIALVLAVLGLAARSPAGAVLMGVTLPVAAMTGIGAIALAAMAVHPVTIAVTLFSVGSCWLLGYSIFGQGREATLGNTVKKLVMMAIVTGAVAILFQIGAQGLLAPAAMLTETLSGVLSGAEIVQLTIIVIDLLVVAIAGRLAASVIRLYEVTFLPGTTRIRIGDRYLSQLLTREGFLLALLGGIAFSLLLGMGTGGYPAAVQLLGTVRETVVTLPVQLLFGSVLALTILSYLLVRLVAWIDTTDLTGAAGRGGQFLGSVGVGIAAVIGLPRYAPFFVGTPIGDLPTPLLAATVAAGPVILVALLLVGILIALSVLSRPTTRGLAGAGSAGPFVAAPLAALTANTPLLSFGGVALAIIIWDLQETGIGIREDLGTSQLVPRNELIRAGGSIVVGAVGIGVAWGVHSSITSSPGGSFPPLATLTVLGGIAVLTLYIVSRAPSTGADVGD